MKVSTNIRRRDLVLFNVLLAPRLRSTYVTIAVIALGIFAYSVWQEGVPQTKAEWAITLIPALGGGVGAIIGGMVCSLLFILSSSTKSNGILGTHQYEITADGLTEKTNANEGLSKWTGIQDIRRVGPFLVFKISGYLFHLIPVRSFEKDETSFEFEETAKNLWRKNA